MNMKKSEMITLIKRDEGYRESVYIDSVGVPTLGWGHALHVNSFVPPEVCELFFEHDFKRIVYQAERFFKKYELSLNSVRQFVIINMMFNMGYNGVTKFKNMIAALQERDYEEAAVQMLDSKWAGQVGNRSTYLACLMRVGKQ